jgi:hypothetical protein
MGADGMGWAEKNEISNGLVFLSPTRAPDGPSWAEKNESMGYLIIFWPSPPWAGLKLGSSAHALAREGRLVGAHGLTSR